MARQSVFTITLLLFSCANNVLAWRRLSDASTSEQQERFENVIDGLKKVYKEKLQPLEEMFFFESFYSFMTIDDSEFDAKPTILLLGQYSTGKTAFIRYLLGSDFEGMEIGPEPTTDSFMAVMYGEQKQVTPGIVLVGDKTQPFRGLSQFGPQFLRHFKTSNLPNPVLKNITLIDTPGIVSKRKQLIGSTSRYNFVSITSWFAERADMIILFFDVNKVDIFDEYESIINSILKHHKKFLVVLNKADTITTPELIYVYGRLMWNLLTIIRPPEPIRVYISSFWDKDYRHNESHDLFDQHKDELFTRIKSLSRWDGANKVTRMTQRAHQVRTHAHILCHLRNKMPWVPLFVQKAKQDLIDNLEEELGMIQAKSEYQHDFLDVKEMQEQLRKHNFMDFPTCDQAKDQLRALDGMFSEDLAEISQLLTKNENQIKSGTFSVKHFEL